MRILVSNDDGIYSPGIAALAEVAAEFGSVRIVAPNVEQSSMGHAITASRPLSYRRAVIKDLTAYSVNGTPADCVALGAHHWDKVDWVLSGCNLGLNLGNSIWHSGTLAAAKQAALLGIRGVALSAPVGDEPAFKALKPWMRRVLETLFADSTIPLINVNFPRAPRGLVWTRVSVRQYDGRIVPTTHPLGRELYWFTVTPIDGSDEGTDRWAIEQGWVSLTPLRLDLTDEPRLADARAPSARRETGQRRLAGPLVGRGGARGRRRRSADVDRRGGPGRVRAGRWPAPLGGGRSVGDVPPPVASSLKVIGELDPIVEPLNAHGARAVSTAEDAPRGLHSVAEHAAPAVLADRGERMNGTLEAVERIHASGRVHLEELVVVIAADDTRGHEAPPLPSRPQGCNAGTTPTGIRAVLAVPHGRDPAQRAQPSATLQSSPEQVPAGRTAVAGRLCRPRRWPGSCIGATCRKRHGGMSMEPTMRVRTALERLKGLFLETSGRRLTLADAARKTGLEREPELCHGILAALEDVRFLGRSRDGIYYRRADAMD